MRKLLCLFMLSALPCFAQTSGTTVTQYQVLSLFGTTNAIRTNELIAISIRPGTASERLKGVTFLDLSNLLFSASARLSDLTAATNRLGGLLYVDTVSHTNLNGTGTLTNLGNYVIPANTLTNTGDSVRGEWRGPLANAKTTTNRFTLNYGSQTILDTGSQIASNGVWKAGGTVTMTGSTNQHVDAFLDWTGTSGSPFSVTNVSIELTQTNSITNLFVLKCASTVGGAITNRIVRIWNESFGR